MSEKFLRMNFSEKSRSEFKGANLLDPKFNAFIIGITDERVGVYKEDDLLNYFRTVTREKYSVEVATGDMREEYLVLKTWDVYLKFLTDVAEEKLDFAPIVFHEDKFLAEFDFLIEGTWYLYKHEPRAFRYYDHRFHNIDPCTR
ncbi:hypothetical protein SAMN05421638_2190 [Kaistella treverensis]|uniref:Uncharacterized protein n=1 Tax=Kaistella treverensis TaxID=631455 RepID=A0A1I3NPU8_9FLAO|nr:hypothetical protein [Kaistella treverensis]SFJ10786.1 hypothetical protein SAMN05421638_2190 [Kaistella treverensis]